MKLFWPRYVTCIACAAIIIWVYFEKCMEKFIIEYYGSCAYDARVCMIKLQYVALL